MTSEPTTPTPETPRGDSQTPESHADEAARRRAADEILQELSRLGSAFATAAQAAWQSEERKHLEQNLNKGLNSLAEQIEEVLTKVGKSEQAKDLMDRAEDVAESVGEKVRSSKVTADLKDGLVKGLTSLTEQIQRWTAEMERRREAAPGEASAEQSESQEIPVRSEDDQPQ